MFDYQRLIKQLDDFDELGKKKQVKVIERLMSDKDFAYFLFQPKDVPNLTEVVDSMFAGFTKATVLKRLIEYVEEEGYEAFSRTQAVFFYTIVSLTLESANTLAEENAEKKKNGDISRTAYEAREEQVEEYMKLVKRLFKAAKKIVKEEAKEISSESGLPYELAKIGCLEVPERQYIDRHKVSRFLYLLLEEWYENVDEVKYWGIVNWKTVFKRLFGKDYLAEVATHLLLEGHSRRDTKCSSANAEKLWDSLTEFALRQMNDAPEQVRDQMIELYIKKVSRMFTNGTYELRVNLLSIPEINGTRSLANLSSSILKYKDRLKEVFKKSDD